MEVTEGRRLLHRCVMRKKLYCGKTYSSSVFIKNAEKVHQEILKKIQAFLFLQKISKVLNPFIFIVQTLETKET